MKKFVLPFLALLLGIMLISNVVAANPGSDKAPENNCANFVTAQVVQGGEVEFRVDLNNTSESLGIFASTEEEISPEDFEEFLDEQVDLFFSDEECNGEVLETDWAFYQAPNTFVKVESLNMEAYPDGTCFGFVNSGYTVIYGTSEVRPCDFFPEENRLWQSNDDPEATQTPTPGPTSTYVATWTPAPPTSTPTASPTPGPGTPSATPAPTQTATATPTRTPIPEDWEKSYLPLVGNGFRGGWNSPPPPPPQR